jgi:hypothetical protein
VNRGGHHVVRRVGHRHGPAKMPHGLGLESTCKVMSNIVN